MTPALGLAIVELVVVTILVVYHARVPLSATPFFFVLAVISLRSRGLKWRDVGFVRPARWLPAIALGGAAGIAMELFATFVTVPFLSNTEGKPPDLSDLRPIVGNPLLLFVDDRGAPGGIRGLPAGPALPRLRSPARCPRSSPTECRTRWRSS